MAWRERQSERKSLALIRMLQEGNTRERWQAARELGAARSEATLAALLDALGDQDPLVRWQVAASLAARKDPTVLTKLQEALTSQERRRQVAAADALGLTAQPTARTPTLQRLLRYRAVAVRHAAAEALGRLQDVEAAPLLAALAADRTEDLAVRYAALTALGRIGSRLEWLQEKDAIRAIVVAALADPCPLLRSAAACAAGPLVLREAVPALEAALRARDPAVRWQAARALARLGRRTSIAPLKALLTDSTQAFGIRVSWLAARALVLITLRAGIGQITGRWQTSKQLQGQQRPGAMPDGEEETPRSEQEPSPPAVLS